MAHRPAGSRAILVAALAAGFALPAGAGVWDFHGGAGMNIGRSDNPEFVSRKNPNFDPNSPFCDPSDPNTYDPTRSVCQATTPSSERRGDLTGSLSLSGGATATWTRTAFDITYNPSASFYHEQSSLNNESHRLNSSWRHQYSPRATLSLTEYVVYSPEQELDPNQVQQNAVLTERTSTTTSSFRGQFQFQKSEKTSLGWSYRYQERVYSSEDYINSANHAASFEWRRRLGSRSYVSSGYEYGIFSYKHRFPGSETHVARVGCGFSDKLGFTYSVNVGYNILFPDDPDEDTSDGLSAGAAVGWRGTALSANAGYSHGISDGGGVYVNSTSENSNASIRWTISRAFSAELAATYHTNERLDSGTAVASGEESIRTFNGRSTLTYNIGQDWRLTAGYSHYRQSQKTGGTAAPDLRSNWYSIGVAWSFN